jgi:hypothetical protein
MCWSKKTTTQAGVKVDANKVPGLPAQTAYDRALAILLEECVKHFGADPSKKALDGVTIEWWDRIAPSPSTGGLNTVVVDNNQIYSGLTVGRTCKVAWRGKIYRSAFCHELLHVVSEAILGDPDAEHANDLLWKVIDRDARARLTTEDI